MKDTSQADLLNHVAVELQAQGRSYESLKAFQQAMEAYRAAGDRRGEGRCLNGVGALYKDLGDPQAAVLCLEQALAIRRETNDRLGETTTLLTLGPVYQKLGRQKAAEDSLTLALYLAQELGNRKLEGETLYNFAEILSVRGQPGRAYPLWKKALEIAREQENSWESAKCLNALACACGALGKTQEALSYCHESLEYFEKVGNARGYSAALYNIGTILLGTNLEKQSRAYFEQVVAIDLQTNALGLAGLTMTRLADTYLKDDLKRARELAERALSVAEKIGDKGVLCAALSSLAAVMMGEGQSEPALETLDKAQSLAHRSGQRHQEGSVLHGMALALVRAGHHEAAFSKFEESIRIFDEHYTEMETEDFRLSYFNSYSVQTIYFNYISRLVEYSQKSGDARYAAKAFHISERRHARGLREFLRARLRNRAEETTRPRGLRRELQGAAPDWAAGMQNAKAPSVAETQARLLDENTVLLEYSLHNEVSYLWVLTRNNYAVISLPLGGTEVCKRIHDLRQALNSGSESYLPLACELYRVLVQPVESWLYGKEHLIIIPDNALHLLPFQMLVRDHFGPTGANGAQPTGESSSRAFGLERVFGGAAHDKRGLPYLIRDYCITYAPSAGILEAIGADRPRGATARKDLIAFAPVKFAGQETVVRSLNALPGTLQEVDGIAGLFRSDYVEVRKFERATKRDAVSGLLNDFRFVHFATHGFVNDDDPDSSAIILHGGNEHDAMLRTDDISRLELNAELVVLSACETALGTVKAGEGVLGLTRAFLCAGTRSVCASMWKVNDEATAALMCNFYRKLVMGGLSRAEALRESQLELARTGRWSSPLFWASFVLVGARK